MAMIKPLDYRCLQATRCRRFLTGEASKNCSVPLAAFDARRTPDSCDGFLPRITAPITDADRKTLDAACTTTR